MMQFSNLLLAAPKYFYHQIEGFIGLFFSLRSKILIIGLSGLSRFFLFAGEKESV